MSERSLTSGRDLSIYDLIAVLVQANLPVLVWGEPGTGKTAFLRALALALSQHIEVLIASIREPTDFGGLPVVRPEGVVLHTPSWALRLLQRGGILLLDEITTCPPSVQAALLRVVHERVVGDTPLPMDKVRIIAAANPPEQAAGGWSLSPPMANRFAHVKHTPSVEVWVAGMVGNWPVPKVTKLPSDWTNRLAEARSLVASYIQHSPTSLQRLPKEESKRGEAWPSCRTWDYASTALAAAWACGGNPLAPIAACIGEAETIPFMSWAKNLDLPDPEVLLADPKSFQLPERQDKAYAVINSLTAAFLNKPTEARWNAMWDCFGVVIDAKKPDLILASSRQVVRFHKTKENPTGYPAPLKYGEMLPVFREIGALGNKR
jgi:hypothetical protein